MLQLFKNIHDSLMNEARKIPTLIMLYYNMVLQGYWEIFRVSDFSINIFKI